MNKAIKDTWVAALRSGKYKQCTGRLKQEKTGEYCVLGVLADSIGMPIVERGTGVCETGKNYDPLDAILGRHKGNKITNIMIDMNDFQDKTFLELADYIDANL